MTVTPGPLRAATVALAPSDDLDLYAVAGATGVLFDRAPLCLAGRGVAATLALPAGLTDPAALAAALGWLADHTPDDDLGLPGSGPVAFGALPFDRGAATSLVVPELLVARHEDGRAWATVVSADPRQLDPAAIEQRVRALAVAHPVAGDDGRAPVLVDLIDADAYETAVAEALVAIEAGEVQKVVLARCLEAVCSTPIDVERVVRRLHRQEPTCTPFSLPVPGGQFVGAAPELLLSERGRTIVSHPLAGTIGLTGDAAVDQAAIDRFAASAKDRNEHGFVVREIAAALGPRSSTLSVPEAPSLVRLDSVAHFGTRIEGVLAERGGRVPHALALLADLHPTAAVAGVPRDVALPLIARLEGRSRGTWAGAVGWVDARGDGDWMIALRSGLVAGDRARLWAGAGIVAGSEPAAEFKETAWKLAPMLRALSPGAERLVTA